MIEIKNITYRYDAETDSQSPSPSAPAVDGLSLTINDGETVCIVGHNGSGKSTVAKHINGLLLPTEGDVIVDGMNTRDESSLLEIRKRVGMVFQNPDNQIVTTVVEEDVGFGPENLGVPSEAIWERVDEALELVGMTEYRKSAPHMLSGGQKQRIAIAGMLAMHPKMLVLDEATAMLDPAGRKEVLSIVRRLNKERGMTVVMLTQDMEEASECDRIAVMSGGKLFMQGTPSEVFARGDELRSIGLDVPAAVRVCERLRAGGLDIPRLPVTVEEAAETICRLL